MAAEVGLPWGANVIVGHPGETKDSLVRSAKFVENLFCATDNLTGFLSVVGIIATGMLADRFRRRPTATVTYLFTLAGIIALITENVRTRLKFSFSDDDVDNDIVELQFLAAL